MTRGAVRNLAASLAASCTIFASPAWAVTVANGPDDICGPADDPCIVDDFYDVQAPGGLLDFGLRTVQIVQGGRFVSTATVLCGAFIADTNANNFAVDTQSGTSAGSFTVRARRACSGDGVTPCFDDAACSGLGLGTCSVGDGSIHVEGKLASRGDPGGVITIEAAGDIAIDANVNVNGFGIGSEAGRIDIQSFMGSIATTKKLRAQSGAADQYNFDPFTGGSVALIAALDVTIGDTVEINKAAHAGDLEIIAGRDVTIRADVNANADAFAGAEGGYIDVTAAGDLLIGGSGGSGKGTTRLSTNGDRRVYYYGSYPGNGGYQTFVADTIVVDEHVILESDSGQGAAECFGYYGGEISLLPVRTLALDGNIQADGRGKCTVGGTTILDAPDGIIIGDKALIKMRGKVGGDLTVSSDAAVEIDGQVDVRGDLKNGVGYYSYHGYGGTVTISGTMDLRIGGSILSGSDSGSQGPIDISVCRLAMTGNGRIDQTHGAPISGPFGDAEDNVIAVGESMSAEVGTKILVDGVGGGRNRISYREPNKPPVLLGEVDPAPELTTNPSLVGCPVCGNDEIDQGESCDDGNTSSGDGCRDDCQDEGCVAASPGFPGTPLCDDGDACTLDVCDPVAHACSNVPSCEEGVACTVDACVAGACEHTPDDSACDDGNECTDDLCNVASGCVYADLTGPACEDGDLCTVTGACQFGTCVATDPSFAQKTKIIAKFRDGAADDQLKIKTEMPLSEFTTNPTVTGMLLELRDASDLTVFGGIIPAGEFEDQNGEGEKFKFRDSQGEVPSANGISSVSIKVSTSKGVAKTGIKIRDADLSGLDGELLVTASLLFGIDPAADECVTARRIPCTPKTTKNICRD